jgi:hypothetical protein
VNGQLVGEGSPLGDLYRIHVADQIGNRDIGGGELLDVAVFPVHPGDLGVVAPLGHPLPGECGDRRQGVIVDLAPRDLGAPLVQEVDQGADHARLRLAPLSEEDEVVTAQQGVLDGGNHRVVVAQDARKQLLSPAQLAEQVGADLLAERAGRAAFLAKLA